MKKKLIGFLLLLTMAAALTACNGKEEEPDKEVETVAEVKEEEPEDIQGAASFWRPLLHTKRQKRFF